MADVTAPPAFPSKHARPRRDPRRRYRIRNGKLQVTLYGHVVFGYYEGRRKLATAWKRAAMAIYEWIWP